MSQAIGTDDGICVHFVLFMSLFVTENSSLHVVDTVIFELYNVLFALSTSRVILFQGVENLSVDSHSRA